MKHKVNLTGRAYGSSTFPDEKAIHTQTFQVPRTLHLEVLSLVEDGQFVSIADFYRTAARFLLDSLEEREDGRN